MPSAPPRSALRPSRRRLGRARLAALVSVGLCAGLLTLAHQPANAAMPAPARGASASEPFRVATFNVLGASHTERGKKRRIHGDYRPRMRRTVRFVERHDFEIIGFQEYQTPQHELFLRRTQGRWGVYPGLEAGRRPVQNSIVWRTDEWTVVEKRLYEIPYFRGKLVQQPYVRLRSNQSGQDVWVINTHNPANSKGPAQHWRDEAMAVQAELASELERTGVPVLLVGDFNNRPEAFCAITGASDLKAVNGGGWPGGVCDPPRRMRIDWIFASKAVQVLGYVDLKNRMTSRMMDHPVVFAEVALPRT